MTVVLPWLPEENIEEGIRNIILYYIIISIVSKIMIRIVQSSKPLVGSSSISSSSISSVGIRAFSSSNANKNKYDVVIVGGGIS